MVRLMIKGEDRFGDEFTKAMMFRVNGGTTAEERLNSIGFTTRMEDGRMLVDFVVFSSKAQKMGVEFGQEILSVLLPAATPPKQLMYIPAIGLLIIVYLVQRRRRDRLSAVG